MRFEKTKITKMTKFRINQSVFQNNHYIKMRFFTTSFMIGFTAWIALSAFTTLRHPRRLPSFAFNTAVAHMFGSDNRFLPGNLLDESGTAAIADSASYNVLLFNYSAYDSLYAAQMRYFLSRELPGANLTDYKNESVDRLERLLEKQHAVVITYPSGGDPDALAAMGKKLENFVRNGGVVVITGTHETSAIQALGLLSPDEAYYYEGATVQPKRPDHGMVKGVAGNFNLSNFVYPMEFADSDFVTVAEAEGMSVLGYKEMGEGKVIYLGLEYYTDEVVPSKILSNIFSWSLASAIPVSAKPEYTTTRVLKRTEEILYAGSVPRFDLKIYPNPYVEKAALEINIDKQTMVSAEMTNEMGSVVALLLPQKMLTPGFYRLEIPNLEAGIYVVHCKIGNHIETRKVVKVSDN